MGTQDVVILSAKRTPFGAFNGSLKTFSATDLAIIAAKSAIEEAKILPKDIQHVVLGNVQQTSADAIYSARHLGLKTGVPVEVPALIVNRLCGSGFQAVITAAEQIKLGEAQCILVGGTENMSQAPHVLRGGREGFAFGKAPNLSDSLWESLTDSFCNLPMGLTAEKLATEYSITREQCDSFALSSQRRWAKAQEAGYFKNEIVPVEIVSKKGTTKFEVDEHPRPQSTPETLAKLPPVFKKEGVITAANASGISDGAAAMIVTSLSWAKERGLRPLAKVSQWGIAGVEPSIMGIGPVPAIKSCLQRAQLQQSDIDLFEVNEAFAPQYLAVEKELGLDREKTNVNGGAIALGHPLAASGARITAHLVHELLRRGAKRAIGSACIGGGQGIALLLETL